MLNLSLRQIKIINQLFQSEQIESSLLLNEINISNRTLQTEITAINEEFTAKKYKFHIAANYNRSYTLDTSFVSAEEKECLRRESSAYLNDAMIVRFDDFPRRGRIIRLFMMNDGYVRSEDLVSALNISVATLTNDMHEVRDMFKQYDISIVNKPYYGMKVHGDGSAIRSCLIDFCDIYDIYNESKMIIPESLEQYHINKHIINEIRIELIQCLQKNNIHLNEMGFRNLFIYLLILCSGYQKYPFEEKTYFEKEDMYQSAAANIIHEFKLSEKETAFIANLLLIGSETVKEEYIIQHPLQVDINCLLQRVLYDVQKNNNLDLQKKIHVMNMLRSCLYSFLVKKENHICIHNAYSEYIDIIAKVPVSLSLAVQILEIVKEDTGLEYYHNELCSLAIELFSAFFIVPNEYNVVRVAFLGPYSADTIVSTAYRLNISPRLNIQEDFYSFYEKDNIDFTKYDCVFVVGMKGQKLVNCSSVVLYDDFFFHQNSSGLSFFNTVVTTHRKQNYLFYNEDNRVHISIDTTKNDWLQEIMKVLRAEGYTVKFGENIVWKLLEINADHMKFDPYVICLLNDHDLKYTVYCFDFIKDVIIKHQKLSELQIVIMDPKDNVLAVKQADSYVRRMQERCIL